MIYFITNIIEISAMLILFGSIHILIRKFRIERKQHKEQIEDLKQKYNEELASINEELEQYKRSTSLNEVHRLIEVHKVNSTLIDTLDKIKRNYSVSKKDKTVIMQWLIVKLCQEDDYTLLLNVNTGKKYTYPQAVNIIKEYIMTSLKDNISIKETLNAIVFLLSR